MIEGTVLDNLAHILTVFTAFALFIISFIAYRRHKKEKFLYICLAFLIFAIKEIITRIDVIAFHNPSLVGIAHAANFVVLILFFIGVIK